MVRQQVSQHSDWIYYDKSTHYISSYVSKKSNQINLKTFFIMINILPIQGRSTQRPY